ncbi:MAG: methyltransferase domain-containing protein [Candidatus Hydrogenedentes bacterium]|nr:methyltransferase domain-containing protein [Candidatus Hydrogenedentota bacterium]
MVKKDLVAIGDEGCHDEVRRILNTRTPCKILDLPCGHGVLAEFLHRRGWDVHCADIDSGNMHFDQVPFTTVDLNRPLCFESASFDAILCANGLHRLYNPGGAIAEFARILRPEGTLYITLNNYSSLDKRIRYLIIGSVSNMINRGVCEQTIDAPEAHVRVPLIFPQLAGMLEKHGFSVDDIRPSIVRTRDRLLAPLAFVIRILAVLTPYHKQRDAYVSETNGLALMPGGSYFFLEARKRRNA